MFTKRSYVVLSPVSFFPARYFCSPLVCLPQSFPPVALPSAARHNRRGRLPRWRAFSPGHFIQGAHAINSPVPLPPPPPRASVEISDVSLCSASVSRTFLHLLGSYPLAPLSTPLWTSVLGNCADVKLARGGEGKGGEMVERRAQSEAGTLFERENPET